MSVRVENTGAINFGVFATGVTVTHARIRIGSNDLVVRALTASRAIAAGGQAEFAAGAIDLVFPENQLTDAGLEALLDFGFDGTNVFLVDLMTSATQVVTVSGYSQQSVTAWTTTIE